MRRRRNAANPGAEESAAPETTVPEAGTPDTDTTGAPPDPAPETPPARPRRTRRSAAETPAPDAPTTPPAEPEPRSRRRTRRTEPAAEAPAPEPEAPATPEPAPAETPSTRRRRRTREVAAETTPAPEPEPPAAPEPVAEDPAPAPSAEPGSSRRRRGRRGGGGGERPADEAPATPDATPEGGATENDGTPRRTRGLRRTRTVPAPQLMVSGTETPEPPAADDASAETEDGRPARTRGQRRPRAVVALAATTPAEPLPPIYQPLPADILARLPETRIAARKGIPELSINGDVRFPVLFFVNTEMDPESLPVAQRQIRLAYEAGVRLFTVLAHLPWKARSGERRYGPLDEILDFVAQNAPEALILPRLIFSPPASWTRAYPDQITRYRTGETGDVSIASTQFWEGDAEEALRAAVEHVAQGPHAHRVFGFYLEHGEWLYEKGVGYDLSAANVQGFRRWLRQKYRNSVVHLRAGWFDGGVTFETAAIPDWPPPAGFPPGTNQFFTEDEQRWVDFHQYSSDIVAQVILRLARTVKEASGGRSAVAVSYGYTLELPRAYSGHLALESILASPNIDILTGPVSYTDRVPGGAAAPPAPIDSIALAGKLWIVEDDTKTYLASGQTPDTYNPAVTTIDETRAVHARNFGAAITRGAGVSWMDLWGEGWLDDRETWNFLGGLREIGDLLATRRRNPRTKANAEPDVAVLIDESAFFEVRNEALLESLVTRLRDTLARSGARVGFYLLSDLARKNFPSTPKLLLFVNAFRVEPAVRAAIRERFQDEGRTLAWLYAPGSRENNVAELAEVVGMHLKLQPWGSKTGGVALSQVRSPLTEALRGQKLGDEMRINPSLCVNDPRAEILAEYPAGSGALAVRRHPRWQSVFIGEPSLSAPLLRGLLRLAGVPLYGVDDDVCWVGDALICLHSAPGGGTTLFLPEDAALYDLVYGETLAASGYGARFSMPPRGTRLLFYSNPAEVGRFGGEPETAPPGLTRDEVPRPAAFVFDTASPLRPEEISPEDEALFVEALEEEIPIDSEGEVVVAEPEAAPEAEAVATPDAGEGGRNRRRRRRRRGGQEDGTPVSDEDTDAEPAARVLPPLEELLPESETPVDTDLPLPADPTEEPVEAAPRRRRRRRGGSGEPEAGGEPAGE